MQTRNDTQKLSLINGRIHTQSSTASCITFEHGRIVSIDDEAASLSGKVIDLHGRTVLPGFCDSGLDFLDWAENQERLNLSNIRSAKELTASLTAWAQADSNEAPLRGWYIAQGLPGTVHISRDDLDDAIPSRPCAVIDADKTHAVLNTPAMSEFNMPQDNTELEGFIQHLPPLSPEDVIYLVKTYAPKVNALGITEVWADFSQGIDSGKLLDTLFNEAYEFLTFRLRANFGFEDVNTLNDFLAAGLRTGDGLPFCRMGGILVNDSLKQEEQKNMINSAHVSGCQIIGTSNQYCINALERVIKRFRKNSRHLLRGFSVNNSLVDRMRILGLGGIAEAGQNDDRLYETFRNGIVISAGSGQVLASPLKSIGGLIEHGLSVAEALNVYTWACAWNGGTESRRGELAVGNDADVVVLEQDPFSVKPEETAGIDVTMTFSAGRMVYDSGAV
ncbi:MAG: amidohydrolase family protein [Synergistaceae bacterium]|nr:amidohydrolase family protein [Synergistaceae bacterium]